ncbi:SusD/RagB family nutrient-binding outer membrane lipoprotein [Hymenobacter sp. H14-R3]|uniref:SusD/RagB family nutrient-binding outer membrane lipoprotein n=1 Tax=Hymenobacter sp. H14-R3 TaxID=3046308 RepID=UPI0024B93A99|nr:SusD/RagB family nutrient-binding outer membrane lipoprotein [Hymenobacter sp. H14-R3]MDJ0364779.1 SusD/RagB family nutrient-binding outer membrane lipoprotein [Hymenobacter sp. H14-R3]
MFAAVALATAATGCKSFLDINDNPNQPTAVAPDAILAQALTITAQNYTGGTPSAQNNFNSYASWAASYWGKTAVVSGFGEELTYNYSSNFYAALWSGTFDNLNDYNLIQINGAANYPYHAAIARIMKVYNFQLLVDEYGDIPYSQALLGIANVTPKYDKAADVYKDLLVQLDGAISDINKTKASATATFTPRAVSSEDIIFGGDMKKWKQFANSLKLRILLRESQTGDAALNATVKTQLAALQTSSAADGFISADVVAQPTYAQAASQQNPLYNRYAYTPAGSNATERSYQIPTQFILNQYLQNRDPRISQLYTKGQRVLFPDDEVKADTLSQYVGSVPGESNPPNVVLPLIGSRFLGANAEGVTGGFFKGVSSPTALMLLSEHLFSKAEAEALGLFPSGDAKADYLAAIQASFSYFYRSGTASTSTVAGTDQYNQYIAANPNNGLVDWEATTTTVPQYRGTFTERADKSLALDTTRLTAPRTVSKQEKIVYQKYLALNTVASTESWSDYRRTGFPKLAFSSQSSSPRADKLATRLLYPQSEINTNNTNIPAGVTQFTKIFWDSVD